MEFTGELRVLQRLNNYEFGVELWIIREGLNRNKWDYRNLETYGKTFLGTPILCAFVNGQIGDGHNMRKITDARNGEVTYSFMDGTAERIVGAISEDEKDLKIQEKDGEKWLVAKGKLFAFYAQELVDKIVRTGRMNVSAETDIKEKYMDGNNEVFVKWSGVGVTILGEGVEPAIPNARIAALAAMQDEFKELKLRAASLCASTSIDKSRKTKEKGVKKLNAFSKKQIAELDKLFDGYTVLSAAQDNDGIYVCLMSDDGTAAQYILGSMKEVIVPEKITKTNAGAVFTFNENINITVDTSEMTDIICAKLIKANTMLSKLTEELNSANATIKHLNDIETKRRLLAAEAIAQNTLDSFNENRSEKVDSEILQSVKEEIHNNSFTNCLDSDGMWNGDKAVAEKVLALCATAVMKMDRAKANSDKNIFAWEKLGTTPAKANAGSITDLLNKFDID